MRLHLERAWVDDIKIHDPADPLCPHTLRSARRIVDPRRDVVERTLRHGALDRTKYFGGQTIDLAGYTSHNDGSLATENAYDELGAALAVPSTHVFRFRRLGRTEDEQIIFKQSSARDAPAEGWSPFVRWAVSLFAGDPRVYGAALKSASYDPTEALSGGGAPMPLVFPLVFSTTTTSILQISNSGTFSSPPVLTIHGPIEDPIIDLLETGESITFDASLGVNDVLIVDVATRTVTLNGASRLDLVVAGQTTWFELVRGTNRLRLRGSGMVAATPPVEGTTNLILNGGGEVDGTGWTHDGSISAFDRQTDYAKDGVASLGGNAAVAQPYMYPTAKLNVTAGLPYTAHGSLRHHASADGFIQMLFYDDAGASMGAATGPNIAVTAGVFTKFVLTADAPAGATKCWPLFYANGATVGQPIRWDAMQFEQKAYATDYVDTIGAAASRAESPGSPGTSLAVSFRDARI